jgi:uracil-DNA glycosylase
MNENDSVEIERDQKLREAMEFRETLNEETDRGCALMAASFLDEQLRKMLEKCLVAVGHVAAKAINGGA